MTHDEMIAVIQAHKEVKIIEWRQENSRDGWSIKQSTDSRFNFVKSEYRVKPEPKPITREEITAQWVKDNDVKVGDKVKLGSRGVFQIYEIFGNKILIDLGGYKDFFNIEELKKVTSKIIPFTFEDRELFRDKWVRFKKGTDEFKINAIAKDGIMICGHNGNFVHNYDYMLEKLEFIDGKPFGKEIWE